MITKTTKGGMTPINTKVNFQLSNHNNPNDPMN